MAATEKSPPPATDFDIDEVTVHDLALPPATEQYLAMPPALVQAAQDDPEVLNKLTRGQLAVVQDRMVRRVLADREVPVSALAQVHEQLSKNARVKTDAAATLAAGGITINFHFGEKKEALVIEGQAADVTPG